MTAIKDGRYWEKPWSLVSGCTRCSPGCDHCWALAMEKRFRHPEEVGRIQIRPDRLGIPLHRKKPTVYAIWNDLFHEAVMDEFQDHAMRVISVCPQHTFLILTKRPTAMREFIYDTYNPPSILSIIAPNIYWGLTVCNQKEADEKLPVFVQVPGKKWLSLEPLLTQIIIPYEYRKLLNCVVVGGETGPGARPLLSEWVRSIRDQCLSVNVPFFFKRWDSKRTGRIIDGQEHNELPWRNVEGYGL